MKRSQKTRRTYELLIPADAPALEAIALVEFPAIEADFVTMTRPNPYVFARMDAKQQIAIGPAMIPNKLIARIDEETGEEYDVFFTPETVRAVAHNFIRHGKQGSINLEHQVPVLGNSVVEAWTVMDPEMDKAKALGYETVPETFMIALSIPDKDLWAKVESGQYRGFSIEGYFVDQLVKNKQLKEMTTTKIKATRTVEVEMTQAILQDKTPIYTDSTDFTVGANVYTDTAMTSPIADGEYVLDDGTEIEVKNGAVADTVAESTEPADTADGVGATDPDDTEMVDKKRKPAIDLPPANQQLGMTPDEMFAAITDLQKRLAAVEQTCSGQAQLAEQAAVSLEMANAKIAELSRTEKKEKPRFVPREIDQTAKALSTILGRK